MMWFSLIMEVLATITVVTISISFHEYGHLMALREKQPSAKLSWEEGNPTLLLKDLSIKDQITILLSGIIVGAIPLIPLALLVSTYWSLAALTLYLIGCSHDFKTIWRLWR